MAAGQARQFADGFGKPQRHTRTHTLMSAGLRRARCTMADI